MPLRIALIANCDDAVVFWRTAAAIPDCWGFAIERERRLPGGAIQRTALDNRTGFAADDPKSGDHRPSTQWPFQRYWWADYSANLGDEVRYRVCPMVRVAGRLEELVAERSAWTAWTTLSGRAADNFSSFFNRGLVISQFMARYLEALRVRERLATRKDALKRFKESLADHELPIRRFLAGALRTELLDLLGQARRNRQQEVHGALYELDDDELIDALAALGRRAHVVLANGSIQAKAGETAAEARQRDQNKDGRRRLQQAGAEVFDRFISPGALGHNKFLVLTDGGRPTAVWTGSTNWTRTGLCTQINNGLLVRNRAIADQYYAQWERLRDAGSAFPKDLVDENCRPKSVKAGRSSVDIWFSRTRQRVDLEAIDEALAGARDGVLFLMFQPGGTATLKTVRGLQKSKPDLYLKGVVSTLPAADEADEGEVDVTLLGDRRHAVGLDIVQPEGIRTPFASWAAAVTRSEFITRSGGVIGFAIVHSKLIVIDPFTRPVVITGSHNFSTSASSKNDENFLIVRGNAALARHYAAHVLAVYHHYRWLAFVNDQQTKGRNPKGYLREHDRWQKSNLQGPALRELKFWVR